MCIASLKHLQKLNFNTKGHFSTLNYDPSSEINFQRSHFFFIRGWVVKKGSHFTTGSLFTVTSGKTKFDFKIVEKKTGLFVYVRINQYLYAIHILIKDPTTVLVFALLILITMSFNNGRHRFLLKQFEYQCIVRSFRSCFW